MVANVTETGYLTIAEATSVPNLSAFQRMYILSTPIINIFYCYFNILF